jgi:hypothetical protein
MISDFRDQNIASLCVAFVISALVSFIFFMPLYYGAKIKNK